MVDVRRNIRRAGLVDKEVGHLLLREYPAKLHHVLHKVLEGTVENPPAVAREGGHYQVCTVLIYLGSLLTEVLADQGCHQRAGLSEVGHHSNLGQ